jgi:hypothetical protein
LSQYKGNTAVTEMKFIERQNNDENELNEISSCIMRCNTENEKPIIGVLSGNREKHIGSFADNVHKMMENTGKKKLIFIFCYFYFLLFFNFLLFLFFAIFIFCFNL